MPAFSWVNPVSGDWGTPTNWNPAVVPYDPAADVTIDAPTIASYVVTIGATETEVINSLSMNTVANLPGSNSNPYHAAILALDGTLAFAPGSPGTLGGSLQSEVFMNNGTILNPGTLNAFIQGSGNVLMTGTNGIYITNWLQALNGIVTVDTKSIAEMTGTTLFDGIFEAQGPNSYINLGGPRQNMIVNIQTITGPPTLPTGWTEVILTNDQTDIGEWNGTAYVPIESTLTQIGNRATVDVLGSRNYTTPNPLTVTAGGLLNLAAGTVTAPALNINGGTVQGSGAISGPVVNSGTLRALGGLLSLGGPLTGAGFVTFDLDQKTGTVTPAGTTMEVHAVGPAQTFIMNGDDTLVIDDPAQFAGVIQAKAGDKILLGNVVATSATIQGNSLVVQNAGATVATLGLSGDYAGNSFAVAPFGPTATALTVAATAPAAAAPPAPPAPAPVLPAAAFAVQDLTSGATIQATGSTYTGPLRGVSYQYAAVTSDSLRISATGPNVFITGGPNADVLDAHGTSGTAVLAGGGGSDTLIGGSGTNQFLIDIRNENGPVTATVDGFHSGDALTVWGITPNDFRITSVDNAGSGGSTGLALTFAESGRPAATVVLAGHSTAELASGALQETFGTAMGSSGNAVPYLMIRDA